MLGAEYEAPLTFPPSLTSRAGQVMTRMCVGVVSYTTMTPPESKGTIPAYQIHAEMEGALHGVSMILEEGSSLNDSGGNGTLLWPLTLATTLPLSTITQVCFKSTSWDTSLLLLAPHLPALEILIVSELCTCSYRLGREYPCRDSRHIAGAQKMLSALYAFLEADSHPILCPRLVTVDIETVAYPGDFEVRLAAALERRSNAGRWVEKLRIRAFEEEGRYLDESEILKHVEEIERVIKRGKRRDCQMYTANNEVWDGDQQYS
ncbi:hypothetical protein C8Q80DRAFT_118195 [Daedaleopsis nitida]|nr:hypothetical protein C8Q80DRAFT_118195 [Daedaleopsis nitida]